MKSSNTVLQPFNHCIFDTPGMHLFCLLHISFCGYCENTV